MDNDDSWLAKRRKLIEAVDKLADVDEKIVANEIRRIMSG
jgi:hypothetical protein